MSTKIFTEKKKLLSILLTSLLLGVAIFLINSKPTRSEHTAEITPTLFVHGYKGGPRSFETMMNRFQELQWGSKRMVIYVGAEGHLSVRGSIPHTMNPFVQVLFENDRASISAQTHWMKKVMHTLYEEHGIEQVNLVGHSMGGLASTSFLLNNQDGHFPKVEKLAVIASPFKGIEKKEYFEMNSGAATVDLRPGSEALRRLLDKKDNFDKNVDTLAIAGVINKEDDKKEHWDGLVHTTSAQGLREIVPFGNYQEEIVYGKTATHSGLHEHTYVDQVLGQFLWKDENDS